MHFLDFSPFYTVLFMVLAAGAGVIVPMVIFSHLTALWQLRSGKRSNS
jgi:hypothetical protein